jgi:hypothetical protein
MLDGVVLAQRRTQGSQGLVLRGLKGKSLEAFELDPDGVIVALLAPAIGRHTGVPGALVTTDKLEQLTSAPDQEMGRHLQTPNLLELGVGVKVELVREELLDASPAVLSGR